MPRILIVDDEENMRRILSVLLKESGCEILEASCVREALAVLGRQPLDVVVTDQKLPDGDGLSVLAACRESDPTLPVVMLTAFASVQLAVDAMRAGAFDFITKPFMPEVVRAALRRACERAELLRENERLKVEVRRLGRLGEILGESSAIRHVRETIARAAPSNVTVLITGETGTGKELVARAIHDRSLRAEGTFVAVNCASFPETLLESELFGHERGAFTGADRARQGLFETAHRGTLFLDEAAEMSPSLQAKLLRVLNDGQILRVGASVPRTVDVRIVAATHRDLESRVREGLFREDLYFRIAVVPLAIPPLRERIDDLPLLLDHFLRQVALELGVSPRAASPGVLARLKVYRFPGNVRELRNLVERAYILSRGETFGPEDFPVGDGQLSARPQAEPVGGPEALKSWIDSLPAKLDLRATVESVEHEMLVRALRAAGGVQAEAARNLGISRSDMAYKVRKYGLVEEP